MLQASAIPNVELLFEWLVGIVLSEILFVVSLSMAAFAQMESHHLSKWLRQEKSLRVQPVHVGSAWKSFWRSPSKGAPTIPAWS